MKIVAAHVLTHTAPAPKNQHTLRKNPPESSPPINTCSGLGDVYKGRAGASKSKGRSKSRSKSQISTIALAVTYAPRTPFW